MENKNIQENEKNLNKKLTELLELRQEQAFQLQYAKTSRFLGKIMSKFKHYDPILALRPKLDEETSGIKYVIDDVSYGSHSLFIRGWAFSQNGLKVKIRVRDDKDRMLDFILLDQRRDDVEETFGLQREDVCGFKVVLNQEDVLTEYVYLQLETFYGYFEKEIRALGRKKDRIERSKLETAFGTEDYHGWSYYTRSSTKELAKQRKQKFAYNPLISVIVPLYNTPLDYLENMIQSVLNQTYNNVQLCLADGSEEDQIEEYIKENYQTDSRIVYKHLKENAGISGNTNEAYKLATGDFIMLCDHDDEVMPNACYEMVKALNEDTEIDVIYTDEDKMTMDGKYFYDPHFKPDYNEELLSGNNYICHIFFVRKSIMDSLEGPFRSKYDGAQDFDLILRCCEKAKKIHHIPKVLYHWRNHPLSTAGNPESKTYAYDAGRNAVAASYERKGIQANVSRREYFGLYRTEFEIIDSALVSIIIDACSHKTSDEGIADMLEGIYGTIGYDKIEVRVVYNKSQEKISKKLEELQKKYTTLVQVPNESNVDSCAAVYNLGAENAKGKYYIFMNCNMRPQSDGWVKEMLSYCQMEKNAVCGCKILCEDDTIWHAGIVVGMYGSAGREFEGMPKERAGYAAWAVTTREVSAVSGACIMVDAKLYDKVGKFSVDMGEEYYDVDFCLKMIQMGKKIIYNPYTEMLFLNIRSNEQPQKDEAKINEEHLNFVKRWKDYIQTGDPYFNNNLSLNRNDCSLR